MKKITVTVPEELDERMVKYAKETGLKKSALVQVAVRQYLDSQEMMKTMPDMVEQMKNILAAAGKIESQQP